MKGIKKIGDFESRFFKAVYEKRDKLISGNIEKELTSGKDFPVSIEVDFNLLISEISALRETKDLFEDIIEEVKADFNHLLKSESFDDFVDKLGDLVEVDQLKRLPKILRGIIAMEVGLALSFVTVINNFKDLQIKDYEDSFNKYFFTDEGYKTVSGDLIVRPRFPKVSNLPDIRKIGNQINAERYIRDLARILVETTGDRIYGLKERYGKFTERYQDKKKFIEWFDSFGDLAEASLLPVVEGIINGAFSMELNPLVAAAVGTFCSVSTKKAVEHSYLTLLGI
jgi:hypothetical protein